MSPWTITQEQCQRTTKYSLVKPVLSGHSKRRPKIGLQDRLSLNAGQKYCRMLQWEHSAILSTSNGSILQYFRSALSYHFPLRPLFCLFLSGRLQQDFLITLLLLSNSLCDTHLLRHLIRHKYTLDFGTYCISEQQILRHVRACA